MVSCKLKDRFLKKLILNQQRIIILIKLFEEMKYGHQPCRTGRFKIPYSWAINCYFQKKYGTTSVAAGDLKPQFPKDTS
jgi:hypothetical protein